MPRHSKPNTIKFTLAFTLLFYMFLARAQTYVPGQSYFDSTGFVEYLPGNLPVVISVPHGGNVYPDTIPDRSFGTFGQDSWTQPIGRGIYDAFFAETGCYPHLVINLLHRNKFDANRNIGEAADGNPAVEQAWANYHDFIQASKDKVTQGYGRGLFLDLHGHGHTIQRIELGYLLSKTELQQSDATLNTSNYIEESSIRTLVGNNLQNLSHAELLRGTTSFGTLLDDKGFPSVPSATDSFPNPSESYFDGGYNTQRHGSRDNGGTIDAIQIELNQSIRFDATTRAMLIDELANVANQYIDFHYQPGYIGNYCTVLPIELSDFKASNDKEGIRLNWTTLSESNSHYFEIQRSRDAINFQKISQLNAVGNSIVPSNYGFVDSDPFTGINYYRLKQVDLDGGTEYSDIISIEFGLSRKYVGQLYPNPSYGVVNLSYVSTKKEALEVAVFDINGLLLLEQSNQILVGKNDLSFDFSFLQPGFYIIRIGTEIDPTYRKLIVR